MIKTWFSHTDHYLYHREVVCFWVPCFSIKSITAKAIRTQNFSPMLKLSFKVLEKPENVVSQLKLLNQTYKHAKLQHN